MDRKLNPPIFIVTIDTESDDAWRNPAIIKLDNIKEIPRFQELCEKYEIMPTYLLTYECCAREEAVSVFKPLIDKGMCEIGHHLHIWTTPPFQKSNKSEDIDMEWIHGYQYELPDSLFEEKADSLKEKIEQSYGIKPISHRAGRFGIDQRTIDWLIKDNFIVDTSIYPLMDFSKHRGKGKEGPHFSDKHLLPYVWKNTRQDFIIEIPVSVYYAFDFLKTSFFRDNEIGKKICRRLGAGRLLSLNTAYSINFNRKFIEYEINNKKPIINLMLHSSELALHCSPFTDTNENYKKVWLILENTFKTIREYNLKSLTLSKSSEFIKENILL